MVEQHYASYMALHGVFSSREKAEKYKGNTRLGDDIVIYEVELDDEGFIA